MMSSFSWFSVIFFMGMLTGSNQANSGVMRTRVVSAKTFIAFCYIRGGLEMRIFFFFAYGSSDLARGRRARLPTFTLKPHQSSCLCSMFMMKQRLCWEFTVSWRRHAFMAKILNV